MLAPHKKNQLIESLRPLFFQVGLFTSLSLVAFAFNLDIKGNEAEPVTSAEVQEEILFIPPTEIPPPQPPKPKVIATNFVEAADPELDLPEIEIVIDQDLVADYTPDPDLNLEVEIEDEEQEQVFMIVEQMPQPEGGIAAFYAYLGEELKYPGKALRMGVQGKVFVQFVVDEEGNISRTKVVRGIGSGCDEEALRVINKAPKWKPGKQRGKPVKVQVVIPVNFILKEQVNF